MNHNDASAMLGVNRTTLEIWVDQGFLNPSEDGFDESELKSFLKQYQLKSPVGDPWTDLFSALKRGGVHEAIAGSDVDEVLKNALARVRLPKVTDRAALLEQLRERERISSTGVGYGVAFPHISSPSALELPCSFVASFQLDQPIPYYAYDRKDVTHLFMLLVPNTEAHLKIMQQLAKRIRQPEFRAYLAGKTDLDTMLVQVAEAQ